MKDSNYGVRKKRGEKNGKKGLGIGLYFDCALHRRKLKTYYFSPSLICS
jgi:hypothetical protein